MSATATEKTITWRDTPPGSLCEVGVDGTLQLRWPTAVQTAHINAADACWLPTNTNGPCWPHADIATANATATVLTANLSVADCNALQRVKDVTNIRVLAPLLGRFNREGAQVVQWADIPKDSLALIVRDESAEGTAHGDIVWRYGDPKDHARFVGHVTRLTIPSWGFNKTNRYRGQAVILHPRASAIPNLAEMFNRQDVGGIIAACAAVPACAAPVVPKLHVVGAKTTWGDVQPGTIVRFEDDSEAMRWREPDACDDDVSCLKHGSSGNIKAFRHGGGDYDEDADLTSSDKPCVVIGAGLSERMCAAVDAVDDQPQRWAIANGYYGKASDAPCGSAWTWPGGWGVTFSNGIAEWIDAKVAESSLIRGMRRMTRDELVALETRLEACEPRLAGEASDLWTHGLARVELTDLADTILGAILGSSDPRAEILKYVRARAATPLYGSEYEEIRAWLAEQVADWATFHVRPDVRAQIKARARLCLLDILRHPSTSLTSTFRPVSWPTLRALGLHVAKMSEDGSDYLGWWGQVDAPTRAGSAVDLLLTYLADPPVYAEGARAALGDLPANRTGVRLGAPGIEITLRRPPLADTDYAMQSQAEQVCVYLYERLGAHRITVPCATIIDNQHGIAVVARVSASDATAEAPPVVDCGLQPVVLPHDHECDVLVLWPYDPSERGRRAFAAAAVAQVRANRDHRTRLDLQSGFTYHNKLRVYFA